MSSKVSVSFDPRAHWITPDEQLRELARPVAEVMLEIPGLIQELAEVIALNALDPKLTHWYTSLKRIKRLPEKIPPLPLNIQKILNSPCPQTICSKAKPDGTLYTIGEKCTLMLVPENLGTINDFQSALHAHREEQDPENKNSFQFRYFYEAALQAHGDSRFEPTHWELQTDDVLENSRDKSYEEQEELVASLARETSVGWQVPKLRGTIATTFLKKIATGTSLYPAGNQENGYTYSYTSVQETVDDSLHLIVGGFAPSGLCVDITVFGPEELGVAAMRKF